MGYLLNGVDTGGIPVYLIKKIIDYVRVDTLVETGTASGESIKEASKYFKTCHTIELIPDRQVVDKKIKNITWHEGNSLVILPNIVNELVAIKDGMQIKGEDTVYEYVLFFLDSHYSDPVPNTSGIQECPVMQELEIISKYADSAIIIIDDLRLFIGQPPAPLNPQEWPSIQEIFALFNDMFPHSYTTIVDDYILSIPSRLREPIDEEWRSRFTIRYPNAADKLKEQAREVLKAVKEYLK